MSKTVWNGRWIFMMILFTSLIALGIYFWDPAELWVGITAIAIGCILDIGYLIVFPHRYRFDDNGITLYYGFGMRTSAEWKDIKSISERYDRGFPWWSNYEIGYFKTKMPFLTSGLVPKNRKTTELIKKFWHKKID